MTRLNRILLCVMLLAVPPACRAAGPEGPRAENDPMEADAPRPDDRVSVEADASASHPWNLGGEPPYLAAHYMPWFEVFPDGEPGRRSWRHWKWDGPGPRRDPETQTTLGRRDISSVFYPLIGPYNSRDPRVIRYHLETARNAGISVMVVIWYGPGADDSDRLMPALLDEAERAGVKIAVCYEEKINWPPYRSPASRDDIVRSATQDLGYLLSEYGSHPAYLRHGDRPAVFQFNYWGEDELGPRTLTADDWRAILDALPRAPYLCRQNLDRPELHPPLDAAFMWVKPDPVWVQDFAHFRGIAGELGAQQRLDFFMPFVSPGFDDTGVWGWGGGPRKLERNGLAFLEQTMAQAQTVEAPLIQIVTWNDWAEGTVVEPSLEHGFEYLDAIETWWGARTGRPVDLADNREPYLRLREEAASLQTTELFPSADVD